MRKNIQRLCLACLLLISLPNILFAQYYPVYRNLVMEGGGIKGIAYGGALAELEERGILKNVVRVAGTSAGAIQACLLSIGYTAEEIDTIISSTSVEAFNDGSFISKNTNRLFKKFGWFKGDSFLDTLEDLITQRIGNPNLTFQELHMLAVSYPFRDLYVVGADISVQKSVVFSYETHPNMRIADAVRISMSIPLYYKAIWANKDGKVFEEPKPEDQCHLYVDGGILMNYPISIFDHSRYLNTTDHEECEIFNQETLGFRLDREEQIDQELENGFGIAPYEITDFSSYMAALGSILMRNVNKADPRDVDRTIYINDQGMSPRVRKVSAEEKAQMIASGREGVKFFLSRLNLIED